MATLPQDSFRDLPGAGQIRRFDQQLFEIVVRYEDEGRCEQVDDGLSFLGREEASDHRPDLPEHERAGVEARWQSWRLPPAGMLSHRLDQGSSQSVVARRCSLKKGISRPRLVAGVMFTGCDVLAYGLLPGHDM